MTAICAEPDRVTTARMPAHLSRMRLFGWSVVMMTSWPIATVLFCLMLTATGLTPITFLLPALFGVTVLVRTYANRHRRWAARLLGEPIPAPYRRAEGSGWIARAKVIVFDRATWRDAWWLFVHSTAGCVLATVSFSFLAGGLFYVSYPLLFAVTPDRVFRDPFGFVTLHSVGQSFALVPLGLLWLAIWFLTVRPMMLGHARMTRALLR